MTALSKYVIVRASSSGLVECIRLKTDLAKKTLLCAYRDQLETSGQRILLLN